MTILSQAILSICTFAITQVRNLTNRNSRPYVPVQIAGIPSIALFDSGADICCMSESEFRKIPVNKRPTKLDAPTVKCRSASGNELAIKGIYTLPLKVLGREFQHPVRVMRQLNEPMIIGADFMHEHLLAYNPARQKIFWQNDTEWKDGIASLTHATAIPAFSSKIVTAKIRTDLQTTLTVKQELLVTTISEEPMLLSGPSLVNCDNNGNVRYEVLNCGPETIFLDRNSVIAAVERIDEKGLPT